MSFHIGTASWTIPKDFKLAFPGEGSQLELYSKRLNAVEINSSFYRDHKASTYAKWRDSVPEDFRFSVKLSRVFTHQQKLKKGEKELSECLQPILELQRKLGCLLVQLPPKLGFEAEHSIRFFGELREIYEGPIAFEPRNKEWNAEAAIQCCREYELSRVIADPEIVPRIDHDAGSICYYRLHGTPEIYKSQYSEESLKVYAEEMKHKNSKSSIWCIFDNTTFGFATGDALRLSAMIKKK